MSEYIEREAAIKIQCVDCGNYGFCDNDCSAVESIKRVPAADVRPVVFCKDCRHRDPEDHKCDCGQLERAGCIFPVDDDYFCAYGERPNCGVDCRGGNDGE